MLVVKVVGFLFVLWMLVASAGESGSDGYTDGRRDAELCATADAPGC